MNKITNLLKEDLEEIEYLKSYQYDKEYLELLASLGILDDLENWPLYQKMSREIVSNLDDQEVDKHFNFENLRYEF